MFDHNLAGSILALLMIMPENDNKAFVFEEVGLSDSGVCTFKLKHRDQRPQIHDHREKI